METSASPPTFVPKYEDVITMLDFFVNYWGFRTPYGLYPPV
jgi:hypothetical protein